MYKYLLLATLLLAGTASRATAQTCTGLCLQQVTCPGGGTTSVSGTVLAPNGTLPMPNALVYVPNAPVSPFVDGAQCTTPVTGSPLVTATTGADGKFKLTNMPVGPNIPVVIQAGKWRRQVTVSNVPACVDTAMSGTQTRLPRNQGEGSIPKIAMVTGSLDTVECTLRKFGVQDSEFTSPNGSGRIHLYSGSGAGGAIPGTGAALSETVLWGSQSRLNSYDLTMLGCQGSAYARTPAELAALTNYANAGGRVFATHYAYVWLSGNGSFAGTANWNPDWGIPSSDSQTGYIDTGFPKGLQLAQWLQVAGATTTLGQVSLSSLRIDQTGVVAPTQSWVSIHDSGVSSSPIPMQFTFNTPVGAPAANQCGRVQFNEYHVADTTGTGGTVFPSECAPGMAMTPQETMLAFSLLDLTSTITPDQPSAIALKASHVPATFTQGGAPGTVTIDVRNPSATLPANSSLTLTAAIPPGLTLAGMAGTGATTGWTCDVPAARCTRTTSLAAGSSDPIALTLGVAADAPAGGPLTLTATAQNGGLANPVVQSEAIPIRVVPAIAWTIAPIVHPTALGAAQLNAQASYGGNAVSGSFAYSPVAGTVLGAGTHTLSVDFTPDDAAAYASAGTTTTITVAPYPTTTTLSTSPSATVFGQNTTLNASVTLPPGTTNGTISFDDDGTPVSACGAIPVAAGSVQCQIATLAVGAHPLTASFSGTANATPSTSNTTSVVVAKASTIVTLSPPAPITLGQSAEVSASVAVAAPGAGTFGGTVAIDDGSGATCSFTLPATHCLLTPTNAGTKTLTAMFTPDGASSASFDGSSASGSLIVDLAPAHLTLAVADAPAHVRYGQVVDYAVTLKNEGQATASNVPIDAALSSAFDADHAHWQCSGSGSGASCTASGSGVLHDLATLPADRSLTWLVSMPVRADASEPDATFTISVDGMQPGSRSYSSILVLLRDGFDGSYGNGMPPVPVVEGTQAKAILDGDALHEFAIDAAEIARQADERARATTALLSVRDGTRELRVEARSDRGVTRVRLLAHDAGGRERASAWSEVAPAAVLVLGSVADEDGKPRTFVLTGAAQPLML